MSASVNFTYKSVADLGEQELLKLARSSDEVIVSDALKKLADRITTAIDEQGNTFLHLAAAHSSVAVIELVLKSLGEKALMLCKKINANGETPLLMTVARSKFPECRAIINLLLPITLDCAIKPLKTLLNTEAVLNSYPETLTNPRLANNIRMACQAVNAARKDVSCSTSHPDMNNLGPEIQDNNKRTLDELRRSTNNIQQNFYEEREIIKKFGVANCSEYSFLVTSHLLDIKKDRNIRVEIIFFTNDDHVFNMVEREGDINNPDTWGRNAVIVDAWSGEVYPASYYNKLMGFYQLNFYETNLKFNCLRSFDRNYHKLKSQLDLSGKPTLTANDYSFTRTVATLPPVPSPAKKNAPPISPRAESKSSYRLFSIFRSLAIFEKKPWSTKEKTNKAIEDEAVNTIQIRSFK